MSRARIAVVGAAGAVGRELVDRLGSLPLAAEVVGFEHPDLPSDDEQMESLTDPDLLSAFDIVVLAVDATTAAALAPRVAADAHLVDLSDAHRTVAGWHCLPTGTALGVPGLRMVLPSAEADLVVQALAALGRARRVEQAAVTLLEPASGLGRAGLDGLRDQTVSLLGFRTPDVAPFARRAAFDVLSAGPLEGLRSEVLSLGHLAPGQLSVQRARVPVFIGLLAALHVTLGPATVHPAPLAADVEPGEDVVPALDEVAGLDGIRLGRPSVDPDRPESVTLWAACDNLARTAARAASVVRAVVDQRARAGRAGAP